MDLVRNLNWRGTGEKAMISKLNHRISNGLEELIAMLRQTGALKTARLIAALRFCDRKKFVLPEWRSESYRDHPLPIGSGQTISQPTTVVFMLELLQVKQGQKVLDIGFGSGWTTALLSELVGSTGAVYGLEVVPELFALGKKNLQKFAYQNVQLRNVSGWGGFGEASPFDRILVSAAASAVPSALLEQLAKGGRLVMPIGRPENCAVTVFVNDGQKKYTEFRYPGFAFVRFVPK